MTAGDKKVSEYCVCTACDRGWLPVFATMALSFAVNSPGFELKLFFDGEFDAEVEAVRDYVRGLGVIFDIILVGQYLTGISGDNRLSRASWARAFMPEILGTAYRRILYLDCDTLVLSPLDALMATPIHATAAAVKGPGSSWRTEVAALQIPDGSSYFNAGVMLIDTRRWRKAALTARFVELAQARSFKHGDQGPLNLLLREDQHMLDPKWNYTWQTNPPSRQPAIMHFIGLKPWNALGVWGEELFWAYQARTPFKLANEVQYKFARPSPGWEALHRLLVTLHLRKRKKHRRLSNKDQRMWDRRMADREMMAALLERAAQIPSAG